MHKNITEQSVGDSNISREMNIKVKGYILGAIAAATYGMNPLFTLPLYTDGMEPESVLFLRYLFAIPILCVMLWWRGHSFKLDKKDLPPLLLYGILFAVSSITLFKSYTYMDAGIASTILFVYPIMVALIMAFFYKEKLTLQTILCIITAIGGIALLYLGKEGATLSLIGTLLVLGSALAYSIYIVGINKSRLKDMATIKVTLYVLLVGWFVWAIFALINQKLTTPTEWYLWINIFMLSILPTIISLTCTTIAIKYIGSTPTAILGVLEPVTAVFFGVLIFHETLTIKDYIGLILIIVAVTFVISGGKFSTHLTRFRKMFPKISRKKRSQN